MSTESIITDFFIRHNMHHSQIDLHAQMKSFMQEMQKGLDVSDSSLMMIPTYIPTIDTVPYNSPTIVIDAGGTNLRIAVVTLNKDKPATVEHFKKYAMPGSEQKITKDEFYNTIAEYIMPLAKYSTTVSFCFSFPCKVLPNQDGMVLRMSKEIYIDGIENTVIGEEINLVLEKNNINTKRFVIINDTVAAMLGAVGNPVAKDHSDNIGFILGTGINMCYSEQCNKIIKLPDYACKTGSMIINIETGGYALFPRGTSDIELDENSKEPGRYMFEKMISGAYQGTLIYITARIAAEEGLFSSEFKHGLAKLDTFHLRHISDLFDHNNTKEDNPISAICNNTNDENTLKMIFDNIAHRGCKMVATSIAAIIMQGDIGKDINNPIAITAEGTTFYKTPKIREYIEQYTKSFINNELNRYCSYLHIEDATLLGTAVAGLSVN